MAQFETLAKNGRAATRARGHTMAALSRTRYGSHPVWSSQCVHCHAFLSVNLYPYPNEIDIGGAAVALNCPVPRT